MRPLQGYWGHPVARLNNIPLTETSKIWLLNLKKEINFYSYSYSSFEQDIAQFNIKISTREGSGIGIQWSVKDMYLRY